VRPELGDLAAHECSGTFLAPGCCPAGSGAAGEGPARRDAGPACTL